MLHWQPRARQNGAEQLDWGPTPHAAPPLYADLDREASRPSTYPLCALPSPDGAMDGVTASELWNCMAQARHAAPAISPLEGAHRDETDTADGHLRVSSTPKAAPPSGVSQGARHPGEVSLPPSGLAQGNWWLSSTIACCQKGRAATHLKRLNGWHERRSPECVPVASSILSCVGDEHAWPED